MKKKVGGKSTRVEEGVEETPPFKQNRLDLILEKLNRGGEFGGVVLASAEGLSIASVAPEEFDHTITAAMCAFIKEAVDRTHRSMEFQVPEEVILISIDGNTLVCRFFQVSGEDLILALIVREHKRYRRLLTQAVRDIKLTWPAFG